MNETTLNQNNFEKILATKQLGRTAFFLQTAESTNDIAWDKFTQNSPDGTIVVAMQQTKGRGRHGRSWFSPQGGLWFSLLLYSDAISKMKITWIPLVAGVAVLETLRNNFKLNVTLKWPNDLLVNNKKIGGILAESRQTQDQSENIGTNKKIGVVLGIGINCNMSEETLTQNFSREATSVILETGCSIDITKLLAGMLLSLEKWINTLQTEGFNSIRSAWNNYSAMLGKTVTVDTSTQILTGKMVDIDETGALVLEESSGTRKTIFAGDVSINTQL